jgi:hypothetical protein
MPMKWLPPILVHDSCFQQAIKGGARVKPAKTVPVVVVSSIGGGGGSGVVVGGVGGGSGGGGGGG